MKWIVTTLLLLTALGFSYNANDVIINEFANLSSSIVYGAPINKQIVGEWIELLVIKNNVDMRGWRLTDQNNKLTQDAGGEGSLIFPSISQLSSVAIGTYILIIYSDNTTNDTNFPADDLDDSDKLLILYIGNNNLDISTDDGFRFYVDTDNVALLDGNGTPTDFTDDIGIDYWYEFGGVSIATFFSGTTGQNGVSFILPPATVYSNAEGAHFEGGSSFNNDDGRAVNSSPPGLWRYGYGYGSPANFSPGKANLNQDDSSLPVSLTTFIAQAGNNQVKLEWVTESEVQNLGFEIMRATQENGVYGKIGFVEGQFSTSTRTEYDYLDQNVMNGVSYWYKLVDVDINGNRTEHFAVNVIPGAAMVAEKISLLDNYPNPFNPSTTLRFNVPISVSPETAVKILVYNALGQEVKTLYEGRAIPGENNVLWNGTSDRGDVVPGGIYFAVLRAGNDQQIIKMTLIK